MNNRNKFKLSVKYIISHLILGAFPRQLIPPKSPTHFTNLKV